MSSLPERFDAATFALPVPDGALRVMLVEQDATSTDHLRELLHANPGVQVVVHSDDCLAAGALLHLHAPDLILLDVELAGALELLGSLRDREHPPAVVATAFSPFPLKACAPSVVDALLKPATADRVEKALLLAQVEVLRSRSERLRQQLHLVENRQPAHYLEFLNVPIDRQILRLPVRDVDWFHSAGNYVRLHVGENAYAVRHTLKALEDTLDPRQFQRVHRGVIVNVDRVAALHSHASGRRRLRLHDGTQLRLGRSYRGELRQLLRNIL